MKKKYYASYDTRELHVSDTTFNADSLEEAKHFAKMHKNRTPEIYRHKNVRTTVRRLKK